MNADGSNQRPLLQDPGFDDEAPSFSPDGNQIIFTRCSPLDGEFPCAIYRIQADGSGLTQLTPVRIELQDFEPAYSPDGNTIALESYARDGVIAAIYLMNPDGTNLRQVTDAELEGWAPDWSPDGRQIVFTTKCCNPELSNLVVMKRDGQQPRQITQDNGTTAAGRSSWSPQGDAIVFRSSNLVTGEQGIYVINADGSGKKLLLKVGPSSFQHGVRATTGMRVLRNKKKGPPVPTQIEVGGAFPRWGTAQ
jgi:TolB protein